MEGAIRLPDVPLAHYRLALEAGEEMRLPRYMGSTLRGGFGTHFRRLVCLQRARESCDGCLLRSTCPYAYIFDPAPPPDAEVLRAQSDVPPAFVLEPPLESRSPYAAGETLEFGLTLIGRAIDYLPYFVLVFRELGERGLGRDRARYRLARVMAVRPAAGRAAAAQGAGGQKAAGQEAGGNLAEVYSAEDEVLRDRDLAASWPDLAAPAAAWPAERLAVEFQTPTRLKHGGRFHQSPDFHVLVRALLRRVSSLSYFHGGQRWQIDYGGWIERAGEVSTVAAHTHWQEWQRYSTRQKGRTSLGGTVGRMVYEGDLAPFLPLLALGEWVHAGKGAVFGNGRFRVLAEG